MTIPRPRFAREMVCVDYADGLIIDGADRLLVLDTETASLVRQIAPLLDGQHTTHELTAALPSMTAESVSATVELLASMGLVEDHESRCAVPGEASEATAFFRRFRRTLAPGGAIDAARRLAAATVGIIAPSAPAGQFLQTLLAESGTGHATLLTGGDLPNWHRDSPAPGDLRLLVFCAEIGSQDSLDDLAFVSGATVHGPWLWSEFDASRNVATIGPFFDSTSPCFDCFRAWQHAQCVDTNDGHATGLSRSFWLSLLATELLYQAVGAPTRLRAGKYRVYGLSSGSSTDLKFGRIPGCPRCRPTVVDSWNPTPDRHSAGSAAVVAFEEYVAAQIAEFLGRDGEVDPAAYQQLQKEWKRLDGCHSTVLEAGLEPLTATVVDALLKNVSSRNGMTRADLATLLATSAGLRTTSVGDAVERWCPSAGNLGSVEAYVIARRIHDLTPGLYFYESEHHSLRNLRWPNLPSVDDLLRSFTSHRALLPDAAIVLTAAFHRTAKKYGLFGYRLINLDAGVALSQLQLVAAGMGISPQVESSPAIDEIERHLRLDGFEEQATLIVSLNVPSSDTAFVEEWPLVPLISSPSAALSELVRQSRMLDAPLKSRVAGQHEPSPRACLSVGDYLRNRRSVRTFSGDPVDVALVELILRTAVVEFTLPWAEVDALCTTLVVASNVQGLAPGVYEWTSNARCLRFAKEPPAPGDLGRLFAQPHSLEAPVQFWIAGDLAGACEQNAAWRHRHLFLSAGLLVHRVSCAAAAEGLAGCIVAGSNPAGVRSVLGLDSWNRAALVAYIAGYPASQ